MIKNPSKIAGYRRLTHFEMPSRCLRFPLVMWVSELIRLYEHLGGWERRSRTAHFKQITERIPTTSRTTFRCAVTFCVNKLTASHAWLDTHPMIAGSRAHVLAHAPACVGVRAHFSDQWLLKFYAPKGRRLSICFAIVVWSKSSKYEVGVST